MAKLILNKANYGFSTAKSDVLQTNFVFDLVTYCLKSTAYSYATKIRFTEINVIWWIVFTPSKKWLMYVFEIDLCTKQSVLYTKWELWFIYKKKRIKQKDDLNFYKILCNHFTHIFMLPNWINVFRNIDCQQLHTYFGMRNPLLMKAATPNLFHLLHFQKLPVINVTIKKVVSYLPFTIR